MTEPRASRVLDELALPIVQAPMAGGPSTTALAIAVSGAGGLGFLAGGYQPPDQLRADVRTTVAACPHIGVNLFVGAGTPSPSSAVEAYAELLQPEARAIGVALGEPRFDDDAFAEKVAVLEHDAVAVVSFTFGAPDGDVVERLHRVGSEVWVTVTSPAEATAAEDTGADAVIVQGLEAGGHRGTFVDDDLQSDLTLLAALQVIGSDSTLPMVAAGSIMTGRALAAVLVAGASAGQLGTAFLLAPEAGTVDAHRVATTSGTPTVLTRAFSGRLARGVTNRFAQDYGAGAPCAYPEVHHLTAPLRAEARRTGDAERINLWAGQAHALARALPAAVITQQLAAEAREALWRSAAGADARED